MTDRFVYPLLRAVLAVLLAVMTAATVLLFCLQRFVFQESLYRNIPQDPEFAAGMTQYVLDDLEAECLFYSLPFDTVKAAVTADWVQQLSQEYATAVYSGLCDGSMTADFSVDPSRYRAVLDSYFAELPEGHLADENAAATLSEDLAESTQQVLSGGISSTLIGYGHRFVYGDTRLRRLSSAAFVVGVATVLLAALSMIPLRSTWRRRAYATAGSLFVGSALAAIPLWLAQRHNLADRLALGKSPMKLYADGIINGVVHGMTQAACLIMLVCFLLLIAAVVVVACEKEPIKPDAAE